MKRILCFGDSNTWGFMPAIGSRYPEHIRWTGAVAQLLGPDYTIIEEGLNGRTTVWEDHVREHMNALQYIGPCVLSHFPLDLIVVMLGTNDLKQRFQLNAWAIAEGLKRIIEVIKKCSGNEMESGNPRILLLSPIYVGEAINESPFASEFEGIKTCEISRQLGDEISRVAEETGCSFLDAAQYAQASSRDSLHMEPEAHRALAEGIYTKIMEITQDFRLNNAADT